MGRLTGAAFNATIKRNAQGEFSGGGAVRNLLGADAPTARRTRDVQTGRGATVSISSGKGRGLSGTAARAAASKPATQPTRTAQHLSALTSRAAARAEVDALSTQDLRAVGRELNIPRASGMRVGDLRREVVDATVGRRLDSAATRGFGVDTHPMTAALSGGRQPRGTLGGLAKKASRAPDPQATANTLTQLKSAPTREDGHQILAGRSKAELLDIAKAAHIATAAKWNKTTITAEIVRWTIGQRLQSDAISRPTRR